MSIYIDNGKTVKHYSTSREVEKAIETLLVRNEKLSYSETDEGITIKYASRDFNYTRSDDEWISIYDKLPKVYENVLVTFRACEDDTYHTGVGYRMDDDWLVYGYERYYTKKVIAWSELPEPWNK